jgi:hypothetical protein
MAHAIRLAVTEEERVARIGDHSLAWPEVPDEHAAEGQHEQVTPPVLQRPAGVIVRPAADELDPDRVARVCGAGLKRHARRMPPRARLFK